MTSVIVREMLLSALSACTWNVRDLIVVLQILVAYHRLLSVVQSAETENGSDTLKLVQILFRHGSRNPTHTYPTNPYNESDFPGGWGQLTDAGILQMYDLGQYLRQRYDGILSPQYCQYETYMVSSDRDRTILSGLAVASGLYSTLNNSSITGNRQWKPFPIRTIAPVDDDLLGNHKLNRCPRYKKLMMEFMTKSETVKQLNEENSELLNYVNKHSQLNLSGYDKPFTDFHDGLVIQRELYNLPLPNWTLPFYNTEKVLDIVETIFSFRSATPELQAFRAGPLLNVLRKNMNSKILGSTNDQPPLMEDSRRKMILFSGHDYTLVQLMVTLDIYKSVQKRPPYASALMIELHQLSKNNSENYFIKFYYLNNTGRGGLHELSIPGYETPISLEAFLEVTQPFIPIQDWDLECGITNLTEAKTKNSQGSYNLAGLGICLLILVAILLTGGTFVLRSRKDYVPF